jgi:hypothetical protein
MITLQYIENLITNYGFCEYGQGLSRAHGLFSVQENCLKSAVEYRHLITEAIEKYAQQHTR